MEQRLRRDDVIDSELSVPAGLTFVDQPARIVSSARGLLLPSNASNARQWRNAISDKWQLHPEH
jgi:hypothetical protein